MSRGSAVAERHVRVFPADPIDQLYAAYQRPVRGIPALPADFVPIDWRVCGCDYVTPLVGGKPVRQADNPAYQWAEGVNRSGKPTLERHISALALDVYGAYDFHSRESKRERPGWPDRYLMGPGGILVRELKAMDTEFYGPQLQTLSWMRLHGLDVGVWKPCCVLSGRVDAELAALTGKKPCGPYARPGGRPAVSGVVSARPAAAPAEDALVLDNEPPEPGDGTAATGYLVTAGTINAEQADAVRTLRTWATDCGLPWQSLVMPWRIVVTDRAVYWHTRDVGDPPWFEITRLPDFPNVPALVEKLRPVTVGFTDVRRCKHEILSRAVNGGRRPIEGGPRG